MIKRFIELLKTDKEFYTKVREDFTYHSSAIEGTTVTREEHTRLAELKPGEDIIAAHLSSHTDINDAIENLNCIKLFDYVFENYEEKLSHTVICKYQSILKKDTLFAKQIPEETGKYRKTQVNAGSFEALPYYKIHEFMEQLLKDYEVRYPILLPDIVEFHIRYECIHPFRDGNGRTGRMIAFKQCLENNVVPFIINNSTRNSYIDSIRAAETTYDYSYLNNYCLLQQNSFMKKYQKYINIIQNSNLTYYEQKIVELLRKVESASRIEIQKYISLQERATKTILKTLAHKKLIAIVGSGKNSRYKAI
jgi:Fic family protein